MSSGTAANCGHTLKVTTPNIIKLGIDLSTYDEEYKRWLKEEPESSLAGFLEFLFVEYEVESFKMKLDKIEGEVFLYRHYDGDIYDDLEEGELYFIFSSQDIFSMERTPLGILLQAKNALPQWSLLTTYG